MIDADQPFLYLHSRNYLINELGRKLYSAGTDRGVYIEVYRIDEDTTARVNPYIDLSITAYWRLLLPDDGRRQEDRIWSGVAKTPQEASQDARQIVDALMKTRHATC
jgi:hypothetical protein